MPKRPNLLVPDPADRPAAAVEFQDPDLRCRRQPRGGRRDPADDQLRRQLPPQPVRYHAGAGPATATSWAGMYRTTFSSTACACRLARGSTSSATSKIPAFSPRVSVSYRAADNHVLRAGFNRAFRSPSSINNYLDIALVNPVDLRGLAPLLPPPLQPLVAAPFPLAVRAVGSELPIGSTPQASLKHESLTALRRRLHRAPSTIGRRSVSRSM